jgi:hypothetical protein
MNKITPQLFQDRFKLTSEITNPLFSEKKAYYRDILHRRNVMVYKHSFEAQDEVKRGLERLSRIYNPVHCVELIGYVHIQAEKTSRSTLLLIYNHCPTLEEFIYDENSDRMKLLSLREILFIFTSVVKMLIFLEAKDSFHGNIDDANLFVDEGGRVKFLPRLEEETNLMFFLRARQQGIQSLPTLLSPEFLVAAREPSNKTWNWMAKDVNRSDLFSLGLLCVRLISPRAFNEGYSLHNLEIDFNRLYILIDTLGTFVDNSFGGILKQCLSFDPAFRPEPFFLIEEINANHSYPSNLLEVMNRPYESQNHPPEYQTEGRQQNTGSKSSTGKQNRNQYESKYSEGFNDGPSEEAAQTGLLAQLPRKPLTKTIKLLHKKEYDEKDLFTNSDKNLELERLKAECLHFIENKIFDNLPHRTKTEFKNNGTKYVIKTMRDGVQIGFIIYPNNNIYFGYIHESKAEDLGMLFMDNKEVYFGEFRSNKISGHGIFIFSNNTMYEGDWLENKFHGNMRIYDSNDGNTYWCVFDQGKLIAKSNPSPAVQDPIEMLEFKTLPVFYYKGFKRSSLVKELHEFYNGITTQQQDEIQKDDKYRRGPLSRAHLYKRKYDDALLDPLNRIEEGDFPKEKSKRDLSKSQSSNKLASSRKSNEASPKKQESKPKATTKDLKASLNRAAQDAGLNRKKKKSEMTKTPSKSPDKKKGTKPVGKKSGGKKGEVLDESSDISLERPKMANRKERAFEELGKEGVNTRAHKDMKDLLNNGNKEFTYHHYFDDLSHPPQKPNSSIVANLHSTFQPPPLNSNKKYFSPPKHISKPLPQLDESEISPRGELSTLENKSRGPFWNGLESHDENDASKPSFVDYNKYNDFSSGDKEKRNNGSASKERMKIKPKMSPIKAQQVRHPSTDIKKSKTEAVLPPREPTPESYHLNSNDVSEISEEPVEDKPKKKTPKDAPRRIKLKKNAKHTKNILENLSKSRNSDDSPKNAKIEKRENVTPKKVVKQGSAEDVEESPIKDAKNLFGNRRTKRSEKGSEKEKSKPIKKRKNPTFAAIKVTERGALGHSSGESLEEVKAYKSRLNWKNLHKIPKERVSKGPGERAVGYDWVLYKNGEKFYGYFLDGKANGQGTFYFKDGEKCSGRWKMGVFQE